MAKARPQPRKVANRPSNREPARVREALRGVWKRLPSDARTVLERIPPLRVVNDPGGQAGHFFDGRIRYNAGKRETTREMVWTLVHELAHAYLARLGSWATMYLNDALNVGADPKETRRVHPCADGLAPLRGDIGPGSPHTRSMERMADAVALSWGFAKEAAAAFVARRGRERGGELDRHYLQPVLEQFVASVRNARAGRPL